jgi:hypothetical protein
MNIYLASVMKFKNWIPATAKDRFKRLQYNETLDDFDVGRLHYRICFNNNWIENLWYFDMDGIWVALWFINIEVILSVPSRNCTP